MAKKCTQIKDHNCEPSLFLKASNKSKFSYLASSTDPSPNILVRMGVEKRVKTTRRPKKPPASLIIVLRLMLLLVSKVDFDWSDEDDQLTESVDDSGVELTLLLIISTWTLLQPVTSGNRKLDNKF